MPSQGCTVLLRGASTAELSVVKRILLFGAYVAYALKLETGFLLNEFVGLESTQMVHFVFCCLFVCLVGFFAKKIGCYFLIFR
jgi:hypothetical protein